MKKVLRNLIIIIGLVAIGLAVLSNYYESELFTSIVIFTFAITSLLIGIEAIINRKIILISRYSRKLSETYIGIAAYAHGITFIILAGFLFVVTYLMVTDSGDNVFKMIIRRPGFLFVVIGIYILSYSIIAFAGYQEQYRTTKFVYYLDLMASRLLPGVILLFWGVGFVVVGLIEILDPVYFDSIGGGFLEVLFNAQ